MSPNSETQSYIPTLVPADAVPITEPSDAQDSEDSDPATSN